jgi:proteic killer suppression protein
MIQSFIHKGLEELFTEGKSSKVQRALASRIIRRLDAIDSAMSLSDLNVPGFNFHGLEGKPKRFSIHINGPWCITFEWFKENAYRVNLENYH